MHIGYKFIKRQWGTTLVEMVVSLVIISVAMVGVMMMVTETARHSADPMLQEQATAIAQAYLEEIYGKDLTDPDGGETFGAGAEEAGRNLYDDVWDYHGLSDSSGAADQAGSIIAGLESYNVSVTVDGAATINATAATMITVTVTNDAQLSLNISVNAWRLQ